MNEMRLWIMGGKILMGENEVLGGKSPHCNFRSPHLPHELAQARTGVFAVRRLRLIHLGYGTVKVTIKSILLSPKLLIYHADGGSRILWKFGTLIPDCTALHSRTQLSSKYLLFTVVSYFSAAIPVTHVWHNGNYTCNWTWRTNQSQCLFIRLRIPTPTKASRSKLHSAIQQTFDKAP